jgi:hypothetical protein
MVEKGLSMNDINAVLVTHEHLDHAQSVQELVRRGFKVYAPQSVYERFNLLETTDKRYIISEMKEKSIADGIKVFGFPLDHENDDGSSTYNLGYVITVDDTFKILFVTDTKHIRWNLSEYQFNVIFIEANNLRRVIHHSLKSAKDELEDIEMKLIVLPLDSAERQNALVKKQKIKQTVNHINRVVKSHMMVEKTAKTLATFDLSKTDLIYLIHLSSFTQVNTYEFKGIISDKLKETRQFRTVQYTDKTTNKLKLARLPKIIVAKRNGDWT